MPNSTQLNIKGSNIELHTIEEKLPSRILKYTEVSISHTRYPYSYQQLEKVT